ncbi:hypothetical protein J4N37_24905 [Vibrio sp. SCSIO 43153]|uniref:hypothetical protein n=1 Tax=Vibrio sp. SCSIO 43153 TaxID=2819098 RepID=UPI002075D5AC|nr:hypothetical protein [Vibrio sp. SCSIO 43153]USD52378.1 hypothetical protein J4N37_24905 [Vibrio sp. SCSIO 43153]
MVYLNIDHEKLEQIISNAIAQLSDKGFYDYFTVVVPSLLTIAVIIQSIYFFKKTNQQHSKQFVAEKELERVYEAIDCFFRFCDSSGLYFSLEKYKHRRLSEKSIIDESFANKITKANLEVTSSFTYIKRAVFILHSLGFSDLAHHLTRYESSVINLRRNIIEFEKNATFEGYPITHDGLADLLETVCDIYDEIRISLLVEIHGCQEKLLKGYLAN